MRELSNIFLYTHKSLWIFFFSDTFLCILMTSQQGLLFIEQRSVMVDLTRQNKHSIVAREYKNLITEVALRQYFGNKIKSMFKWHYKHKTFLRLKVWIFLSFFSGGMEWNIGMACSSNCTWRDC